MRSYIDDDVIFTDDYENWQVENKESTGNIYLNISISVVFLIVYIISLVGIIELDKSVSILEASGNEAAQFYGLYFGRIEWFIKTTVQFFIVGFIEVVESLLLCSAVKKYTANIDKNPLKYKICVYADCFVMVGIMLAEFLYILLR